MFLSSLPRGLILGCHLSCETRGTNLVIKNLDEGFTHVFDLTFDSAEGLTEFMDDPVHAEFSNQYRPYLDKFIVVDYELIPLRA
ncbi:hypothetical protein NL676_031042 [Syzygium grande]|nr:hypothetical protein NL676_031042 [Syzygium grande]